MARGDRKEPIILNDGDRNAFISVVNDMCEKTGIIIHAYTLMDNHYHMVLETPEGNLVEGMTWLQNAYTRRFNVYHRMWGHVFGGRYKAILIDLEKEGGYFRRVVDYVHLNPVRAGLINVGTGLNTYRWSSLNFFAGSSRRRPGWLTADLVFSCCDMNDNPKGRLNYLKRLERIVQKGRPEQAGIVKTEEGESLQATVRRGWYFGSQVFKEKMLVKLAENERRGSCKGEDGYYGEQSRDHGEDKARLIIEQGCVMQGITLNELRDRKANDPTKLLIAELVASKTSVRLDWLRNELGMRCRAYCSRLIKSQRENLLNDRATKRLREQLLKKCNI
jgi:REP element-mobilizing transposase RayT